MMRHIEQKSGKLLILLTVDDKLNNYVVKKLFKLKGIFPLTVVGKYCNTVRKSGARGQRSLRVMLNNQMNKISTRKQIEKLIE